MDNVVNPKHVLIASVVVIGGTLAYSKYFDWKMKRLNAKLDHDIEELRKVHIEFIPPNR